MGCATHILTAHHSSPPVVGWIINPISKRYMGLLMRQTCLLFNPATSLIFSPIYTHIIPKTASKSNLKSLKSSLQVR